MSTDWILDNYDRIAAGSGIFVTSRLPAALGTQCSAARADEIARKLGPKVTALGAGELAFQRTVEEIRHCGTLATAKSAQIQAALTAALG